MATTGTLAAMASSKLLERPSLNVGSTDTDLGMLYLVMKIRSDTPPQALLEVPYEALVAEPQLWSRRMVEFAGLRWDEACLDFHRTRRTVRTFSRWQVRQKISSGSVERWRRYATHVGPLLRLDPTAPPAATLIDSGGNPAP